MKSGFSFAKISQVITPIAINFANFNIIRGCLSSIVDTYMVGKAIYGILKKSDDYHIAHEEKQLNNNIILFIDAFDKYGNKFRESIIESFKQHQNILLNKIEFHFNNIISTMQRELNQLDYKNCDIKDIRRILKKYLAPYGFDVTEIPSNNKEDTNFKEYLDQQINKFSSNYIRGLKDPVKKLIENCRKINEAIQKPQENQLNSLEKEELISSFKSIASEARESNKKILTRTTNLHQRLAKYNFKQSKVAATKIIDKNGKETDYLSLPSEKENFYYWLMGTKPSDSNKYNKKQAGYSKNYAKIYIAYTLLFLSSFIINSVLLSIVFGSITPAILLATMASIVLSVVTIPPMLNVKNEITLEKYHTDLRNTKIFISHMLDKKQNNELTKIELSILKEILYTDKIIYIEPEDNNINERYQEGLIEIKSLPRLQKERNEYNKQNISFMSDNYFNKQKKLKIFLNSLIIVGLFGVLAVDIFLLTGGAASVFLGIDVINTAILIVNLSLSVFAILPEEVRINNNINQAIDRSLDLKISELKSMAQKQNVEDTISIERESGHSKNHEQSISHHTSPINKSH